MKSCQSFFCFVLFSKRDKSCLRSSQTAVELITAAVLPGQEQGDSPSRGGSRGSWTLLRKHSGLACSHHVAGGDKERRRVSPLKLNIACGERRHGCVPLLGVFCLLSFARCGARYLVRDSVAGSGGEDNTSRWMRGNPYVMFVTRNSSQLGLEGRFFSIFFFF